MAKTVFQNGDIVTPEFLNALNNPRYSQNPSENGEIPYPPAEAIPDEGITSEKIAGGAVERIHIAYNAVGFSELAEDAWWAKSPGATVPDIQMFWHQTSGGGMNRLVLKDRVLNARHLALEAVGYLEMSQYAFWNRTESDQVIQLFFREGDDPGRLILKDHVISGRNIAHKTITADEIADGAIVGAILADNAVDTEKIVDGAVDSNKLAPDSVTSSKIADNAVSPSHLDRAYLSAPKAIDETNAVIEVTNYNALTVADRCFYKLIQNSNGGFSIANVLPAGATIYFMAANDDFTRFIGVQDPTTAGNVHQLYLSDSTIGKYSFATLVSNGRGYIPMGGLYLLG